MIQNARITDAAIEIERGFALTCWLVLDYGGSGQSFGGWLLYHTDRGMEGNGGFAGHFITRVLQVAEVERWKDLVGKTIRVDNEHDRINGIGHILKNDWFYPNTDFKVKNSDLN